MLTHRLAGHRQTGTELGQGLASPGIQAVEQLAASGVRQRLEYVVHPFRLSHAAIRLPNLRQPLGCTSRPLSGNPGRPARSPTQERPVPSRPNTELEQGPEVPAGDNYLKVTRSTWCHEALHSPGALPSCQTTVVAGRSHA